VASAVDGMLLGVMVAVAVVHTKQRRRKVVTLDITMVWKVRSSRRARGFKARGGGGGGVICWGVDGSKLFVLGGVRIVAASSLEERCKSAGGDVPIG